MALHHEKVAIGAFSHQFLTLTIQDVIYEKEHVPDHRSAISMLSCFQRRFFLPCSLDFSPIFVRCLWVEISRADLERMIPIEWSFFMDNMNHGKPQEIGVVTIFPDKTPK